MVFLPDSIGLAHIAPASIFGIRHGVGVMWVNDGYATGYPLFFHVGSMCLIDVGSICLIGVGSTCLIDVGSMCLIDMGQIWAISGYSTVCNHLPNSRPYHASFKKTVWA